MLDWDKWSVQERCVGELIVEMFEKKDPSGRMGFQPKDIYEGYYDRLKAMWIPKNSSSASRQAGVCQIFIILRDRLELIQPSGCNTTYHLAEEGCLYQELKIRTANRSS